MSNSKPKFTPGPWKFNTTKTALLAFNDKNEHSFVYNASPYKSIEPTKANAALIAAAPDLFAACEIVLNNLTQMIPANEDLRKLGEKACIDALTAALAKARGES